MDEKNLDIFSRVLALAALVQLIGCATADPASRVTSAEYGDINVYGSNNSITIGDGALASADSSGSTETQTATPTNTTDIPVTVKYNDAIAGASAASKGVLETLMGASANKVLEMMQTKESGTVKVTKTDGTEATVECADGQCSFRR